MSKISKVTLSPAFARLIDRYQAAHGLPTRTAALYELIARGWGDWIGELDAREQSTDAACWSESAEQEAALFTQFDIEAESKPDTPHSFAAWFARRFAPKHGGDRKSDAVQKRDGS